MPPCPWGWRARSLPLLLALLVVALAAGPTPARADATADAGYRRPVDGPVVAPFDPPQQRWGRGNRGVDLAAGPGTPVVAAGAGEVRFAGAVAGALHVTLLHPDGLRTTYSFLAEVHVAVGQPVAAGDVVGVAGGVLHWGLRAPDGTYLDPLGLLGRPRRAVLVPGGDDGAPADPDRAPLAALAAVVADGVARHGPGLLAIAPLGPPVPRGSAALAHELLRLHPTVQVADLTRALWRRRATARPCTAPGAAPPGPTRRRIAVLVGGFGSTSDAAAVDDVATAALGYQPADVLRFSYRGGRTPPPATDGTALAGLAATAYGAGDSQGDLVEAGAALAELLAEVAAAEPGVPIDVIAHSQGGVVARLALDAPTLPGEVDAVVTLGTPHEGADLATAAVALGGTPAGAALLELASTLGLPADPGRPALGQLAETSPVVEHLARNPPPPGVRLTSIAARGDLTVPSPRSQVPGAAPPAVVDLVGPRAHDRLPGDPATTRELALAVAGLPPTCRSAADVLADEVVGHVTSWGEDLLGATLAGAASASG